MRRTDKRGSTQRRRWVWQAGFLLVAAFLIHDGYMAIEGHVMAGVESATHAGMTVNHEARVERMSFAAGIDTIDLVAIGSTGAPKGTPFCSTERPAVMVNRDDVRPSKTGTQRHAFIPSWYGINAWQPALAIIIPKKHLPPSRAPDAQRAMFQVYLI